MEETYIAATADNFVGKLEIIQTNLVEVINNINVQKEKVMGKSGALVSFENKVNALKGQYMPKTEKMNNVEIQLQNVLNTITCNIQNWHKAIEEYADGMDFIKKHEKYFVVMVFGAVKTGKSTLGNFLSGKDFINASFKNKYKQIQLPEFDVEKNGRKTGGIVNINGQNCFAEGVVDTTGNMQYFTLLGMRWMDTPGLGAISKEEDKVRMDEMVNKYVPYADMCIFLLNSSEVGLQDELKIMDKMTKDEQTAIFVITKSDTFIADIVNGKLVKKIVAKDSREMQENDLLNRLQTVYPECKDKKYKIMSLSTALAQLAINEVDDKIFRSSNLDKLMIELGNACDRAGEIKEKLPKKTFNNFINKIINGEIAICDDESKINFKSINDLKSEVNKIYFSAKEYKSEIKEKENNLYNKIRSKIKSEILQELHKMSDDVEKTGRKVEKSIIDNKVIDVVNKNINMEINKTLKSIIDNYENQQIFLQNLNFETSDLEIEKKNSVIKYTVIDCVERSPEGFFEHVGSFFGKTYYDREYREVKVPVETIVGTNIGDITENLMKSFDEQLKSIISNELNKLQVSYFAPQETFASQMNMLLVELEENLKKLKFEIK